MTLIRQEPWGLLNQFSSELNNLFDPRYLRQNKEEETTASDWVPAVDIKEEADRFLIHADIPGVDPGDIDVHMENGMLTISGNRESENREEREGYKRVERVRGNFLRRFTLPDTANADKISAESKNGVLEITIPKQEKSQPTKISVKGQGTSD
ncbi:MAG TPA: Hsp20/alpha crystallin family protein [Gammaproteobacteria bacterium]|nr:Hsp20/alpha crystallin family protein [Gammaproteobacteria bacterium]